MENKIFLWFVIGFCFLLLVFGGAWVLLDKDKSKNGAEKIALENGRETRKASKNKTRDKVVSEHNKKPREVISPDTNQNKSSSGSSEQASSVAQEVEEGNVFGKVYDERGGVPGLQVYLFTAASPPQLIQETSTNDSGQYRFENAQAFQKVFVAVLSMGWGISYSESFSLSKVQDSSDAEKTLSSDHKKDIQIFPEAVLKTNVIDVDNNDVPLEDVEIVLQSNTRLYELLQIHNQGMQTDSNGKLEIQGISPGNHTFEAQKVGYFAFAWRSETTNQATLELRESETRDFTFRLAQAGSVFGKVVSRENERQPISGAFVELGWEFGGSIDSMHTGENGEFEFKSAPIMIGGPRLAVRVSGPGHSYEKVFFRIVNGERKDLGTIALRAGGTITGRVVNEALEPIAGATVYVNEQENKWHQNSKLLTGVVQPKRFLSTQTDQQGRFKLDFIPAQSWASSQITWNYLRAEAEGYAPGTKERITAVPHRSTEVEIILKQAGKIIGYVYDGHNRPLPGVKIGGVLEGDPNSQKVQFYFKTLFGRESSDSGKEAFTANIESNQEGYFELSSLSAGKYSLMAATETHEPGFKEGVEVKAGEETEVIFRLQGGGVIYGTYYDEQEEPKAGITINAVGIVSGAPFVRSAETDAKGMYRIEGLTPGDYTLRAGSSTNLLSFLQVNSKERVRIDFGDEIEHDVHEKIPGTTTIFGKIYLDDEPYKGGITLGGGGFEGSSMRTVQSDQEGNYSISNLPLGTYLVFRGGIKLPDSGIQVGRGRFQPLSSQKIRVSEKPEQAIDIHFYTRTIHGKVVMANGEPLPRDTIVFASPFNDASINEGEKQAELQESAFDQMVAQLYDPVYPNLRTGLFSISGLTPGIYKLTARSKDGGFQVLGPLNLYDSSLQGVQLVLEGNTGSMRGIVQNFVPADDSEGILSFMDSRGTLTIEDQSGERVELGGSVQGLPDTNIVFGSDPDTGEVSFAIDGIPVGTWNFILQVNNYAPVIVKNAEIIADSETEITFVLAPSGDLEIQILNEDLTTQAAQDLQYSIKASNGDAYKKRFTISDLLLNILLPQDPEKKNSFVLKDFPPDTYTIELKLPNYQAVVQTFTIESEQLTSISVRFEPLPGFIPPSPENE